MGYKVIVKAPFGRMVVSTAAPINGGAAGAVFTAAVKVALDVGRRIAKSKDGSSSRVSNVTLGPCKSQRTRC